MDEKNLRKAERALKRATMHTPRGLKRRRKLYRQPSYCHRADSIYTMEVPIQTKSKPPQSFLIMKQMKQFLKYLLSALLVWFLGYFSFSTAWLVVLISIYMFHLYHQEKRDEKKALGKALMKNERHTITESLSELPSWVFFPDTERAEWLNLALYQMWPYINDMVETLLRETVEPELSKNVPGSLSGIAFDKISLGDIPPRIGGVKTYVNKVKRNEIVFDVDVVYSGDAKITLVTKGLKVGIEDLQIRGTLRVILHPLISTSPLIGGLALYFLNRPMVDFELTNLLNVLETPGLNSMLRSIVSDILASFMVLPNRYVIPLAEGVSTGQLKNPLPDGVLRLKVIEAKDLVAKDISLIGKNTSDPYVKMLVGAGKFKTSVKYSELNPVWNEIFEICVDEVETRVVYMHVFDEDRSTKDESLGSKRISLAKVLEHGYKDLWVPLENVKQGKLHLQLTWLELSNDADVIRNNPDTTPTKKNTISKAALIVYVDSASNLPYSGSSGTCNPVCRITVGHENIETFRICDSVNPVWEQSFRFLIHDPEYQDVEMTLYDYKKDKTIGSLSFKIGALLNINDMTFEQPFSLRDSSHNATLTVKFTLRALIKSSHLHVDNPLTEENIDGDNEVFAESLDLPKPSQGASDKEAGNSPEHFWQHQVSVNNERSLSSSSSRKSSEGSERKVRSSIIRHSGPKSAANILRRGGRFLESISGMHPYDFKPTTPQGEISLSISYDESSLALTIVIFRARDLLPANKNLKHENMNPYVRIYLLPDRTRNSRFTTEIVRHSSNPIFDETLEYTMKSLDECKSRKLDIVVKSATPLIQKAKRVKYALGRTIIDLKDLNLLDSSAVWFTLYKVDDGFMK